jgi:hypothetical protein
VAAARGCLAAANPQGVRDRAADGYREDIAAGDLARSIFQENDLLLQRSAETP